MAFDLEQHAATDAVTAEMDVPFTENDHLHHRLGSSQQNQNSQQKLNLNHVWRDFLAALRNPSQGFNPWIWIYRLSRASISTLYHASRLSVLVKFLRLDKIGWRPLVPIFAVWLVFMIIGGGYFGSVRSFLRKRWCQESTCRQIYFQDVIISYLGIMILWNYLYTMLASPGVYVPPFVSDDGHINNVAHDDEMYTWKASKSQGGFVGCDPPLDVRWERRRFARAYGDLGTLETSTCDICQIPDRPPRCHHCHTCHRCILRYDHHCLWLNNCIGHYNYRSFLLTLFYISASCFYGVCLLFHSFYEPLAQQIREQGLSWLYSNQTGFLNLPSPVELFQEFIRTGTLDPIIVIKLVYPMMLGICTIVGSFLVFHLIYVANGCTTLEHKIFLERRHFEGIVVKNPFDQGWYANIDHVLGGPRGMLYVFLPLPVTLPPPFLAVSNNQKTR